MFLSCGLWLCMFGVLIAHFDHLPGKRKHQETRPASRIPPSFGDATPLH